MEIIICVVLIIVIACVLTFLVIKERRNLMEEIEYFDSENIEQNTRLLRLEARCKQLEKVINSETRDNSRENKTGNKFVRRNR